MSAWILPPAAAAVVFAGLAVFVWRRRPPAPLWPALGLVQVCALLWVLGELGTLVATTPRGEWLALLVLYTGSIPIGALWWSLALGFAELHDRPLAENQRGLHLGPAVLAAAGWLLFVTNPWHGLYLTPVLGGPNLHHAAWWVNTIASWLLVTGAALIYVRLALGADPGSRLRTQAALLIGASLPVVAANALYVGLPGPWPLDLSVLGGTLTCALFVLGIYATGLFELPPVALREALTRDPSGVILLDRAGRVRLVNPAARSLLGRSYPRPDAVAAQVLDAHLAPAESGVVAPPWRELGGTGGLYARRDDPATRFFVSSAPLLRRGRRVGAWLRLVDVTPMLALEDARRQLALRLRRAERLESLGVLAAGIAHEINNPAGSILLAAEHALRALREPVEIGQVEEALETIVAEARRTGRIVRNVLKFAREESTEKWPVDANRIVARAAERVAKRLEEAGAELSLELRAGLPTVRANPTDLEQALVNLLENALDACGADAHLELRSEISPRGVRLSVRDEGPGMSEEVRSRALEPFFTTRAAAGGSGLGLSLVHGIVREHGGLLELDSAPGLGTRITIELPAVPAGSPAGL